MTVLRIHLCENENEAEMHRAKYIESGISESDIKLKEYAQYTNIEVYKGAFDNPIRIERGNYTSIVEVKVEI